MEREFLNVQKEEIEDYTKKNCTWEIKGNKYKYMDSFYVQGDGQCQTVIVQRESDDKYFEFGWCYEDEPLWFEVKPIVSKKTTYGWDKFEVKPIVSKKTTHGWDWDK